jgi:hypothetical protein
VPRTPFARARTSPTLRTSGLALFLGLFSLYIRSLFTLMRTSERSWDATFSKFSALVYFLAYFPLQRLYMLTFAISPLFFFKGAIGSLLRIFVLHKALKFFKGTTGSLLRIFVLQKSRRARSVGQSHRRFPF